MNRHLALCSVALLGLAGVAVLTPNPSTAVLLDGKELRAYGGGAQYWCVNSMNDPNGVHCDECVSNGNGGFVKCNSDSLDKIPVYNEHQNPGQLWDYGEYTCGSPARHYSEETCDPTSYLEQEACGRMFTKPSFVTSHPGVDCDVL